MTAIIIPRKKFAVYDNETTGLTVHPKASLSLQPRIIEFAGIITDGIEILDEIEFICNPQQAIEEIITKITGLKNEDLEDKPPFEHFIPQVAAYFAQADVAVAHNLSFDRALLQYDMQRADRDFEGLNFPKILCCTVEQSMHQFGRRMKLSELYELYIGPYVQKHRAMDDIRLLHAVCGAMGVYNAFNQ
jgi:DNA polymerase III alpha subunit (gram-positive type)